MKKLSVLICFMFVLIMPFTLFACGKKDKDEYFMYDGLKVEQVVLYDLGAENQLSMEVSIKNTTNNDKKFDLSKFVLKSGKDVVSQNVGGGIKNFTPTLWQKYAVTVDLVSNKDLEIGDKVKVFYDNKFVCEVSIEAF
ncbi:MAG: hypothetical protein E7374_01155 [Clostridiales bacterium]|nr:hypothetical protein [Clostridiales bacterium]